MLWSEEALLITSNEDEQAVLNYGLQVTRNTSAYVGITYEKQLPQDSGMATNQFALVGGPSNTVLFNYLKVTTFVELIFLVVCM